MAKDIALIFIIFFSISGICFYKWIMIHTRIKQMDLIKCQVTDVINRTTYQKNIYDYHYAYKVDNKEYGTSDRLKYNLLWKPKINDELNMYVSKNNPNNTISPWQTYLYKLYFIVMIISFIIPFIVSL